jgi:cytochrome P450
MLIYNPFSQECIDDPFPIYRRLREEAPVYHNDEMGFWALSRYADVAETQKDFAIYSSAGGATLDGAGAGMPLLVVQQPPKHVHAKRCVAKFFGQESVRHLEPFIAAKLAALIDRVYEKCGPSGTFDFMAEVAAPLPLAVISQMLGIPPALQPEILALSKHVLHRGKGADMAAYATAAVRIMQIFTELASRRRENLGDDPVSAMITDGTSLASDDGSTLTDEEVAVRFFELTFAGHDTTSKSLANAMYLLSLYPDQRSILARDPDRISQGVEEIFRYDPPSHTQARTTTAEVTVHGVTIPAGQRILLLTGSAVRDERAIPKPDLFDVGRQADGGSIVFGNGIHKCLGMHLARFEITLALRYILARFPAFEVDKDALTRTVYANVRGFDALPMRLGSTHL